MDTSDVKKYTNAFFPEFNRLMLILRIVQEPNHKNSFTTIF
jgi:hypothetical protein